MNEDSLQFIIQDYRIYNMKLKDKIYRAIEDEERRFDEMNYKSIGLYNNRYNELFEKVIDLEEELAITKALAKYVLSERNNMINGLADEY